MSARNVVQWSLSVVIALGISLSVVIALGISAFATTDRWLLRQVIFILLEQLEPAVVTMVAVGW